MDEIQKIKISSLPEVSFVSEGDCLLVVQNRKAKRANPELFKGAPGEPGESAHMRFYGDYLQWKVGVNGTWINLLPIKDITGSSAYEIAVKQGFRGTEAQWITSLSAASEAAAKEAQEAARKADESRALFTEEEAKRAAAESGRVTVENNRVSAESNRVTAENQRIDAESKRIAAENERISSENRCIIATTHATSAAQAANQATQKLENQSEMVTGLQEKLETEAGKLKEVIKAGQHQTDSMRALEENITNYVQSAPTRMELSYLDIITLGNQKKQRVTAKLYPAYVLQNVLFLPADDQKVLTVFPDGALDIHKAGTAMVHVIPTHNVALYKTIEITVQPPAMHLTTGGGIRLNDEGTILLT